MSLPTGFSNITTKAQQNAMEAKPEGTRFLITADDVIITAHFDRLPCTIVPDGTVREIHLMTRERWIAACRLNGIMP